MGEKRGQPFSRVSIQAFTQDLRHMLER